MALPPLSSRLVEERRWHEQPCSVRPHPRSPRGTRPPSPAAQSEELAPPHAQHSLRLAPRSVHSLSSLGGLLENSGGRLSGLSPRGFRPVTRGLRRVAGRIAVERCPCFLDRRYRPPPSSRPFLSSRHYRSSRAVAVTVALRSLAFPRHQARAFQPRQGGRDNTTEWHYSRPPYWRDFSRSGRPSTGRSGRLR